MHERKCGCMGRWIAYGVVRLGMGLSGYGSGEWFPRRLVRKR